MCTHLFLSNMFIFAATLSLALPVEGGKTMLPFIFLPLEHLSKIRCLNHLWALIYISPIIVEVVVAEVGNQTLPSIRKHCSM